MIVEIVIETVPALTSFDAVLFMCVGGPNPLADSLREISARVTEMKKRREAPK